MSTFCPPETAPSKAILDVTAEAFLDHLGLPLVHPLCADRGNQETADARVQDEIEELSFIGGGAFELPTVKIQNTPVKADANLTWLSSHLVNQQPAPPSIGSISLMELHDHSIYELLKTATTMSAPTIAMSELWLRFFAIFLCPLCLAWILHREISGGGIKHATNITKGKEDKKRAIVCILALASSAVLYTDSLYVYEYGRRFGFSLFVLSNLMALRVAASELKCKNNKESQKKNNRGKKNARKMDLSLHKEFLLPCAIAIFDILTFVVVMRSDGGHAMETVLQRLLDVSPVNVATNAKPVDTTSKSYNPMDHMPDPGIDLPTIDAGLYYSSSNPFISTIVSHWPESSRTYSVKNGATPYLVTGDHRTGIPFLVNSVEDQEHVRVWTQNRFDGEYLALDIAFPINEKGTFVHYLDKPVYLILHGLNGGSHEEYVKDLVNRRRAEGSTLVVLIARGMMDTQTVGWNAFHGARTGDVDISARALRRGLSSLANANQRSQRQILAGVGYSMGAIILSNYVARSGTHCALDAAMAVSGGLDMRQQLNFKRSMRLWQPMLTFGLREDILIGKYARHYKHRLTPEQFLNLLRVTSISTLDVEAIVTYNSFDNLLHYYTEMSAMGDRDPEFGLLGSSDVDSSGDEWGRIANVSIPFAVLQALDDPLVGWRTIGTDNPKGLVDSGSGNLMLVLTKGGGHVGWPLGNNPKKFGWKWMSDAAGDFVHAVDMARKEHSRT